MQHRSWVGGVAEHHEVGLGGNPFGLQPVCSVGEHSPDGETRAAQRHLGFGERRVHDHR